eukprot:CAMPEP_0204149506 /NCGR_PEP_ID=MMETSP0361-20130328/24462_1 /ASSEMBLY_ACC=CAM_ASM_000343 /TAXON_ID=268821 /ORGANISM="Scrippsiella Hangoei, Strain SHTV-5" /LENGTH=116 /DNA_ID=CAMNT_0051104031 /DNA_START=314 /DNA_END=660 /DNA_ORIENTATION=+
MTSIMQPCLRRTPYIGAASAANTAAMLHPHEINHEALPSPAASHRSRISCSPLSPCGSQRLSNWPVILQSYQMYTSTLSINHSILGPDQHLHDQDGGGSHRELGHNEDRREARPGT